MDDPALTVACAADQRDLICCSVILPWRSLGLFLSVKKGQRGRRITWVGFEFCLNEGSVVARIPAETVKELIGLVATAMRGNVVSVKSLRSLAGKLSNAARLLTAWRPFLGEARAASRAADEGGAVWAKQVRHALSWFLAFLRGAEAGVERSFLFEAYLQAPGALTMVLGASPRGFGAVLVRGRDPVSWFAEPLSPEDCEIFGLRVDEAEGQQVWG